MVIKNSNQLLNYALGKN